jgi:flagella basal body P-ring formation protein FlgA
MSVEITRLRRRCAPLLAGFLTLVAGVLTRDAAYADGAWQSPASIRDAARDFVMRSLATNDEITVEAVSVDERLKLAACTEALTAAASGALRNGQGTVVVSCEGKQAWRLFVPVRTATTVNAVVAKRSIRAGEVLAAADVEVSRRSTASLPYQYLTDSAEVVGLTAKRTIAAGMVLVPAALDQRDAVQRGAIVTLISRSGGILVKTEGVALESAPLKQRLRVRSASGRIVEGVVESANEVRVGS